MLKIIHRVNTIEKLKKINPQHGVEIDLRERNNKIILEHDAFTDGELFENYLQHFKHRFINLNIKVAGIEERVIEMVESHGISDYFLLDVEAPYIYSSAKKGKSKIAIRYSEYEPIEFAMNFKNIFDWIFIDTPTSLPLNGNVTPLLTPFKTCLVCPSRWGRPHDISLYAQKMNALNFKLTAVMSPLEYMSEWEELYPNND